MARSILQFFGGGSIALGALIIAVGALSQNGVAFLTTAAVGSGFLLAGAPLLGFARVIVLLEQISQNTRAEASRILG